MEISLFNFVRGLFFFLQHIYEIVLTLQIFPSFFFLLFLLSCCFILYVCSAFFSTELAILMITSGSLFIIHFYYLSFQSRNHLFCFRNSELFIYFFINLLFPSLAIVMYICNFQRRVIFRKHLFYDSPIVPGVQSGFHKIAGSYHLIITSSSNSVPNLFSLKLYFLLYLC